jgi:hypothetical protein
MKKALLTFRGLTTHDIGAVIRGTQRSVPN